jgi:sarcosine oxidase subunit alpha
MANASAGTLREDLSARRADARGVTPAQSHRLAAGGAIDRSRPFRFTFDGRQFVGHPGDTVASALLANGVRLVGRSFKYHRPRGILAAGPEEPNALLEIGAGARRTPNTRATTAELFDGLEATSQNRWPSLAFDVSAANGWFAPLLKAGFYYKTFMWPAASGEALRAADPASGRPRPRCGGEIPTITKRLSHSATSS